ncbi:MAG: fumarate hydratase [Omnitrophica bacterium RBG_13_46_9]|nr:MAG: fumarate hydratase [Omnitrophica bacterium RBG_13_46_9]
MRKVNVNDIRDVVSELCIEANVNLRGDIRKALKNAIRKEANKKAKHVLEILLQNARVASMENRALCQDTGMVSVYIRVGQDVKLVGGSLKEAIDRGVIDGYKKGFLRKSVVKSPILRDNTATNAPPIIYTDIVNGDGINITVMPKGFGSENKSKLKMLDPTADKKEIISFVLQAVKEAGPDACPPYILGIGIGGTFDKVASLAKQALILPVDNINPEKYLRKLERAIMKEVNKIGIGPMGLGGRTTCLGVNILEYPTHIAGLPVAVNVGCHITRSASKVI